MVIDVKVIPGAKKNIVKNEGKGLKVYVTAPADDGKANKAVVVILAEYFAVKKRDVAILKGLKSRHKTIKIGI
ncbi:MAG: YggU family protein [Candidatus Omnitrophica bacterium]|nr:YggU family protein [Candidatus Omnitrophota bacterium]